MNLVRIELADLNQFFDLGDADFAASGYHVDLLTDIVGRLGLADDPIIALSLHRRARSQTNMQSLRGVSARAPKRASEALALPTLLIAASWQYPAVFGGFAAHFEVVIRFESNFANGMLGGFFVAVVSRHYTDGKGAVRRKDDA